MDMTLADIVGLGIGITTLLLTFVAAVSVFLIFSMGRRYSDHLEEVEKARKEHVEVIGKLDDAVNLNSQIISEVHLGFSTINSLIGLQSQRSHIRALFRDRPEFSEKVKLEISQIDDRIKAREIEIRILSSSDVGHGASMQALAQTFGDVDTIYFIEKYQRFAQIGDEKRDALAETLTLIKARIRG